MIGTIAIVVLACYLLIGEPLLGRRAHRRMLAALAAGAPGARLRFYLQWIWQGWVLLTATLFVTLGLAAWTPAELGLRLPDWPHLPAHLPGGMLPGFLAGIALAAVGGFAAAILASRRRRDVATPTAPRGFQSNPGLLAMLPRSRDERLGWAALSVTAGVTEEVIWRGFGLGLLFALLPATHPAAPIVLAAVAFGWAHLYQGAIGVLATAMIGGLLALLFWASGSLLWPIVLHILIDLRVLLTRAPATAKPLHGDPP